jgi:hypothetical protein
MDEQRKELIHFAQSAQGLDDGAKLKLILVAAGVKPATFFALKINPKNLDEKAHLERHLRSCRIIFSVGRPRAYEEIVAIKGNAVQWKINGSWYGYDIFKDKKHQQLFKRYVSLVKRQRHEQADRVSGKLYDYPRCCIEQYIKEHDTAFFLRTYTHYSYFKHVHDLERAFPLVMHTPCSTACAATKRMHDRYAAALKGSAPAFWKSYAAIKKHAIDVVVDSDSEILQDRFYGRTNQLPVFLSKDGYEYVLLTLRPVEKHYYLLSHLTKQKLERGTVFPATVTMQYRHANVTLGKPKRVIKNLHHERHFVIP